MEQVYTKAKHIPLSEFILTGTGMTVRKFLEKNLYSRVCQPTNSREI